MLACIFDRRRAEKFACGRGQREREHSRTSPSLFPSDSLPLSDSLMQNSRRTHRMIGEERRRPQIFMPLLVCCFTLSLALGQFHRSPDRPFLLPFRDVDMNSAVEREKERGVSASAYSYIYATAELRSAEPPFPTYAFLPSPLVAHSLSPFCRR